MTKRLSDLFDGKGSWEEPFKSREIEETKEVFGKPVSLTVDRFNILNFRDYKVEYLNKEGDVIIHFYAKKRWPDNFIDKVKEILERAGDSYECDFYIEVNSWFLRINNFSARRFGAQADASYISSLLETV